MNPSSSTDRVQCCSTEHMYKLHLYFEQYVRPIQLAKKIRHPGPDSAFHCTDFRGIYSGYAPAQHNLESAKSNVMDKIYDSHPAKRAQNCGNTVSSAMWGRKKSEQRSGERGTDQPLTPCGTMFCCSCLHSSASEHLIGEGSRRGSNMASYFVNMPMSCPENPGRRRAGCYLKPESEVAVLDQLRQCSLRCEGKGGFHAPSPSHKACVFVCWCGDSGFGPLFVTCEVPLPYAIQCNKEHTKLFIEAGKAVKCKIHNGALFSNLSVSPEIHTQAKFTVLLVGVLFE